MSPAASPLRHMRPLLGTFVEIAACDSNGLARQAIDAAFASMTEIHQRLSFQLADSELSRLNAAPGQWRALTPTSVRVLKLAKAMMLASEHRFNCTVGGMLIEQGALPNHGGDYLPCGTASDIEILSDRVRLLRPIRVTLDGIAKGFAVDRAIAALKNFKLNYGWVNAGGDMRVFGNHTLAINQRRADGSLVALGGIRNAAAATSQINCTWNKDRPGLIVNAASSSDSHPETPRAAADVVTVIARFAWRADALTKVAANTAPASRKSMVATLGGLVAEDKLLCAG